MSRKSRSDRSTLSMVWLVPLQLAQKKDFLRKKQCGGKLDLRWLGPYTIKKSLGNDEAHPHVCGIHLNVYQSAPDVPSMPENHLDQVPVTSLREALADPDVVVTSTPERSHDSKPRQHFPSLTPVTSPREAEAVCTSTPERSHPVQHSPSFTPVREALAFLTEGTNETAAKKKLPAKSDDVPLKMPISTRIICLTAA